MPEYISVDKYTVIWIEDVVSVDGVVKSVAIYRWNEDLKLFELKELIPLKLRHH